MPCRPRSTFEGGIEGFTVAYTAGALAQEKGRSVRERSDPVWLEAEHAVLAVARRFQQVRSSLRQAIDLEFLWRRMEGRFIKT